MDTTEPNHISFKLLEELTDGFSKERLLGSGAFGEVYRVEDKDGHQIAVKLLFTTDVEDKAFRKEFENLTKLKHPNIIRLVGFCSEDEKVPTEYCGRLIVAYKMHRALCFEYMENGSLEKYISGTIVCSMKYLISKTKFLKFKGLKYLHMGLEEPIKHLDLKPDNILLDKNMMPKIADFGLSRLVGEKNTKRTLSPLGTRGYSPPEFLRHQIISKEFDIFSLGIIILRIMIGQRGYYQVFDMNSDGFASHVYNKWEERVQSLQGYTLLKIDCQQVKRCIEIALQCIEEDKYNRPDIGYIVDQLNEIEKLPNDSTYVVDEVISMMKFDNKMVSMDVHPTKSWIVTGHSDGYVCIWNYTTKELVNSFEVTKEQEVLAVKFIARKHWVVAGGRDHCIHVYNYSEMKIVNKFIAHKEQVTSLAIHPIRPYILSASYNFKIKLWDWEKGWKPAREFREHSDSLTQVAFSTNDTKMFGSVSKDMKLKIWNIDSPCSMVTLTGHTSHVRCLDCFTSGDKQYMIAGSDDSTCKIWDLQEKCCVETLKGHANRVSAVCCHPELPILMTGSRDGTVCLWNSLTFKLEGELNLRLKRVYAFACMRGSRRIVIGHGNGLTITKIDHQRYGTEYGIFTCSALKN